MFLPESMSHYLLNNPDPKFTFYRKIYQNYRLPNLLYPIYLKWVQPTQKPVTQGVNKKFLCGFLVNTEKNIIPDCQILQSKTEKEVNKKVDTKRLYVGMKQYGNLKTKTEKHPVAFAVPCLIKNNF